MRLLPMPVSYTHLYYTSPMGMEESFRKSLFQVISLQTSTGFATDDYMPVSYTHLDVYKRQAI